MSTRGFLIEVLLHKCNVEQTEVWRPIAVIVENKIKNKKMNKS